ncbi:MAG: hypothetical protein DRH37_02340 [Deltaproteobacteria bacterium]|nr:MAG: hypothetical protein DRH37_02340 [Deltaproteobacteria bacterium]
MQGGKGADVRRYFKPFTKWVIFQGYQNIEKSIPRARVCGVSILFFPGPSRERDSETAEFIKKMYHVETFVKFLLYT